MTDRPNSKSIGLRLPPGRVESALRRVRAHREALAYHERQAAKERAAIEILIRTWELCPHRFTADEAAALGKPEWAGDIKTHPSGRSVACCLNPDNCRYFA